MTGPARILILEDDETLRAVIERVLKRQGYQVVAAARGEEAIERARGERFDLIVADIRMDGLNGLDAIEQTQQLQPDIGSIVVSGFASEEETLRAVDLKVEGYLKKPFSVEKLVELVESFLAKKLARSQKQSHILKIKEALLSSLAEQGYLAERLHPGRVYRAARLASLMARHLGFGGDLPRQLYLGTLLRNVARAEQRELTNTLLEGLTSFPLLLSTATEDEPIDCVSFALTLCKNLEPDQPFPEELSDEVSPHLREAYHKALAEDPESTASFLQEKESLSGLFSLAQTLEHGGKWKEALATYEEIAAHAQVSPESLRARFGQARVYLTQGATPALEQTVKAILSMAAQMGPVSLALAEVEAGFFLRRASHPSADKLLIRAGRNAEKAGLRWQALLVRLALAASQNALSNEQAEQLLLEIGAPENRFELVESLVDISPELIWLTGSASSPKVNESLKNLLREHPQEFVIPLKKGRLSSEHRSVLVDVLSQSDSIPRMLFEALSEETDPALRMRINRLKPADKGVEASTNLRIYTLGLNDILMNEERLEDRKLRTQKTRFLLAWLFYASPHALSVDRILEEFWPGPEDNARNNMNTSVSWLRSFLRAGDSEIDPVLRVGETLGLNPEYSVWHDAKELSKAFDAAQQAEKAGRIDEALPYYGRVARLYKGPFLQNCFMDWAIEIRNSTELMASRALGVLVTRLKEQRRHNQVLEYTFQLLTLNPQSEEAHLAVMESYIAMNEHKKAEDHYERYQQKLAQDFPDEELPIALVKAYHTAHYGMNPNPNPL